MSQILVVNDIIVDPAEGENTETSKDSRKPFGPENRADCTVALALRDFCLMIWKLPEIQGSFSDSESASRIIKAGREAKEHLALDEADWKWAKQKIEAHGVKIFGANTPSVRSALDHVIDASPALVPQKKKAAS